MKLDTVALLGLVCGVVGHSHHHEEGERVDPLAAPEYLKDSVEELERKWSFEVRLFFSVCGSDLDEVQWWCS